MINYSENKAEMRNNSGDIIDNEHNIDDSPSWFFIIDTNGAPKLVQTKLMQFLEEAGFAKIYDETGIHLVKINKNIIEYTDCNQIKDFVRNEIDTYEDNLKSRLLSQFFKCNFFRFDNLTGLKTIDFSPHCDTRYISYLYFQNGFVEITSNGYQLRPYSELNGTLLKEKILNHNFNSTARPYPHSHTIGSKQVHKHQPNAGEFEQLIDHQCNNDPQRIQAHKSFIGYLCHSFKIPSEAKAVVLIDEKISDNPSGRSGKSLVGRAISQLQQTIEIAGRTFNSRNDFSYENVDASTDLLFFNDLKPDFKFQDLYNIVTDNIVVNRKYSHSICIDFQKSPKVIITTNYIVNGHGDSDRARRAEYEIYPWYDSTFSPADDFGHQLFLEWDEQEWNRFFIFIIECIQVYLTNGLIEYKLINAEIKRLIQLTCRDFYEWSEDYFKNQDRINNDLLDIPIPKNQLFREFLNYSDEFTSKHKKGTFYLRTFTDWLNCFADCNGIRTNAIKRRINHKPTHCVIFSLSEK